MLRRDALLGAWARDDMGAGWSRVHGRGAGNKAAWAQVGSWHARRSCAVQRLAEAAGCARLWRAGKEANLGLAVGARWACRLCYCFGPAIRLAVGQNVS